MRFGRAAIVVATLLPGCVHHRVEETATDRFRFDVSERPRVEVEPDHGSITFIVPTGFSAELDASTGDGRIENDLPLIDAKVNSTRIKGTLGEGGKLVLIKTSDGRVRLRNR